MNSQKDIKTNYSTATSFYSPKNIDIKKVCPWNYSTKAPGKMVQVSKYNKGPIYPSDKS